MSSPVVPRPRANLLPLYVTVFCLLWSGAFVAGKVGVTDCPPLIFLTIRFLAAGLLVFGLAALRRERWDLSRRDVMAFAVIGIANNALYLGLGYVGLKTISAGLNALIVSANPVFVAVLASLVLGEHMTWRKAIGLLLGVAGVGMIVAHRISVGSDSPVGIAYSVGALVAIVSGTMLFKVLAPKGNLLLGNGVQNLAGGLAVLPFAAMTSSLDDIVPSGRLLAALAFLVVLGSIVAYMLWFHLLTVFGATAASAYHFVMPPLGMLFGWMILGEHVAARDLLGIIPVALGIYLVTRPARPSNAVPSSAAKPSQEGASA
ncbi:DMT family transporter [Bradyrhizobium sp. 2TAF24]|uniref:DMT family transporter n=1 Tax=Bradyrhizobium sp. 2TAF24 TaxID=3233011 RepID=UPI003F8F44D5